MGMAGRVDDYRNPVTGLRETELRPGPLREGWLEARTREGQEMTDRRDQETGRITWNRLV